MVIGMVTTLHKFDIGGKPIFLPCLSYHLPAAEVRLFSPQTFHTLYGGHSEVYGDQVKMKIAKKTVEIPTVQEGANVPIINDSAVTPKELAEIGPHVRSALPHIERKIDFMGRWSSHHHNMWNVAQAKDEAFPSFFGPSVVMPNNNNISGAQKELLLWHNKLGC